MIKDFTSFALVKIFWRNIFDAEPSEVPSGGYLRDDVSPRGHPPGLWILEWGGGAPTNNEEVKEEGQKLLSST